VSWVADEFVDTSDPDIRDRVRSGSGYQSDNVLFSCCDRAARRPCITQFIHDNKKHFNHDYQVRVFSTSFVVTISSKRSDSSINNHLHSDSVAKVVLFSVVSACGCVFVNSITFVTRARYRQKRGRVSKWLHTDALADPLSDNRGSSSAARGWSFNV